MKIKIIVLFFLFFQSSAHANTFASMCSSSGQYTYYSGNVEINSVVANSIFDEIFVNIKNSNGNITRYVLKMSNNTAIYTYTLARLQKIKYKHYYPFPIGICVDNFSEGGPFLIGVQYR
ncbi:TPA: hypothetical protein ACPKAL_000992 [Vibrio alginolyticus]|uniref:hypothetical protein n=1 Tax=Vibrio alginolyticus TaxID=663 RepID=UPI00063DC749|nr:hypothetical protein [Vibrio alginolyticus]KLI73486.1 hypothetical protein AAW26_05990 [Vibrio alginolyticus]MDM4737521.1 hypothetical protein [Vibrio alginolyticus]